MKLWKRIMLALTAAAAVTAVAAFLAWTGGYNFDHRSPDVAFGVSFVISGAAMAFMVTMGVTENIQR